MAAPTVKEVTSPIAGTASRVGGIDWNQLVTIIKGTHASEKIPGVAIEVDSITSTQIAADAVGDSEIDTHTSSKITITTKAQLNSNIVYIDQANIFGNFNQTFKDNRIRIESPDGLTPITIINSQQTLARNLTIPILTGAGRNFVVTSEANQIGNTELTAHTSTKITITAKGQLNTNIVFNDQANVFGNFDQTFKDNRILIESPDGLTPTTIINSQQTLARNLTIPVLTGNRNFIVTGEANQITNTELTTGVFAKITGLGVQTQILVMAGNNITLNDSAELQLGNLAGGDLKIFHNGTNSILNNITGDMIFQLAGVEQFRFRTADILINRNLQMQTLNIGGSNGSINFSNGTFDIAVIRPSDASTIAMTIANTTGDVTFGGDVLMGGNDVLSAGNVIVNALGRLGLDGLLAGNTYIQEVSGDNVIHVIGGQTIIQLNVQDFFVQKDMTIADGKNIILNTTIGNKIGTAANQLFAFHGSIPIIQHASTGQTAGFVAGAGTSVLDDSTFTGGVGTKAYTLGDVVKALKEKGIMVSS